MSCKGVTKHCVAKLQYPKPRIERIMNRERTTITVEVTLLRFNSYLPQAITKAGLHLQNTRSTNLIENFRAKSQATTNGIKSRVNLPQGKVTVSETVLNKEKNKFYLENCLVVNESKKVENP